MRVRHTMVRILTVRSMGEGESSVVRCCLKLSMKSFDNSMSLNIPSSLEVNPPPHS